MVTLSNREKSPTIASVDMVGTEDHLSYLRDQCENCQNSLQQTKTREAQKRGKRLEKSKNRIKQALVDKKVLNTT